MTLWDDLKAAELNEKEARKRLQAYPEWETWVKAKAIVENLKAELGVAIAYRRR